MSKLRTPLTELVGIEHPVVQTGMGWVAGARLVEGNTDAGVLASGQVAGILDDLPSCAELVETIVDDAVKHLQAAAALVE